MKIDVLTLFPGMFDGPLSDSIIKRAQNNGAVEIQLTDIRDFAKDKHRTVDDRPFGGGAGMVFQPEVLYEAITSIPREPNTRVILTSPQGQVFNQQLALELSKESHLVIICGHYEGIDERVRELLVTDEISIGDYVLTGGELPAMVMIDAVVRQIPGVVGKEESVVEDSFYQGVLDYPHYTRPAEFRGMKVPEVLLSGNHAEIARWRRRQALERTFFRRPDLLETAPLSPEDRRILAEFDPSIPRSYNDGVDSP